MPTTEDFLLASKWSVLLTFACLGITLIAFLFKWGLRFRLVGATGFMVVLTAGLFSLSLVPFTRTTIPGAVRFSTVFDRGDNRAVIALPPTVTAEQVHATLEQAASNLFSPGRLSVRGGDQLTIQARTILHPEPGLSQPLPLGEVQRSLLKRNDDQMTIRVYTDNIAKLPPAPQPAATPAKPVS
jgi:hypothetical protein